MLYKDKYHPQVKKDLKRLDRKVVKEAFRKHIDNILRKPKEKVNSVDILRLSKCMIL